MDNKLFSYAAQDQGIDFQASTYLPLLKALSFFFTSEKFGLNSGFSSQQCFISVMAPGSTSGQLVCMSGLKGGESPFLTSSIISMKGQIHRKIYPKKKTNNSTCTGL